MSHEGTCIAGHRSGVHMVLTFPPFVLLDREQEEVLVIGAFAYPYRLHLELSPRKVVS